MPWAALFADASGHVTRAEGLPVDCLPQQSKTTRLVDPFGLGSPTFVQPRDTIVYGHYVQVLNHMEGQVARSELCERLSILGVESLSCRGNLRGRGCLNPPSP